ncbi:MAG: LD-carboxypeptidase [Nitrospinota bacterium]
MNLQKGDIVDIVAPGFRTTERELHLAVEFLKSWGLQPRVPEKIFSSNYLFSHSDEFRLQHLSDSLTNDTSKAVWCLRGGYGCIRLLPGLGLVPVPEKNKLVLGLSDITSLLVFLVQKWKWTAVHGPMLDRMGRQDYTPKVYTDLKKLIFGKNDEIEYRGLHPLNAQALERTSVSGKILGGNLTVIQSSIGTPWQLHGKDTILFFEDIGERGYRVDRMLTHLKLAGVFLGAKAVLFGNFDDGLEPDGKSTCRRVLQEFAKTIGLPVYKGLKTGHGKNQGSLSVGVTGTVTKRGSKGILTCPSGRVRGSGRG